MNSFGRNHISLAVFSVCAAFSASAREPVPYPAASSAFFQVVVE